jgi:tyrosine-protein kinase Etk/Wzc
MNSISSDDLTLITFSDLKALFFRHVSKIKGVSIFCGLACLVFLLLREPLYIAEASFKQMSRQNEIGLSLKESYQQLLSFPMENTTIAMMQSNEVLKNVVEELGMQVVCNPDLIFVKALRRIRDNLSLELGQSLSDPDPFIFRHVSYLGEKPLKLFFKRIDHDSYQILDEKKQCVGRGRVGESLSLPMMQLTLNKIPNTIKLNQSCVITVNPWMEIVRGLRKGLKAVPWKQDKVILKLSFASRDRFLASDILNQVMAHYQKYLKRENDESCQLQLAYLHHRQQELTQDFDEALIDHVGYLKENLSKNGFIGVAQEIEILSQPKNSYTSKLFDVDLELQRLSEEKDFSLFSAEDKDLRLDEKQHIENRLENCDLDQKRKERSLIKPLLAEIKDVEEQIREAKLFLQSVRKEEPIPPVPSLLKQPKSAIALLVRAIASGSKDCVSGADPIARVNDFIDHLAQKRKILRENLSLQKRGPHEFSGLNLTTAQELLVGYTKERDNLQAQMRDLVFLRDHLAHDDFEMSSIGDVFNDSVTTELIQKASAIVLQLKDENNRSDREQIRLEETLQTQKIFLSQYLLQTIELKKLRTQLLRDKITSLCRTTVTLLQSEKELLQDKLQELNLKMGDLPEKWRRETLLMLKKELGSMMLQGVSQIAEAKNLGQHIFQANSKPLDMAIPPTQVGSPSILILSFFSSILAALCFYCVILCKNMLKGFRVTEENLKVSGFPISGSLSRYCNASLSELHSKDLEALRRIALFLVAQSKTSEGLVASFIGGNYPNYTMALAELLSMRGLRVLTVCCVFDQVVHAEDMPGLWQYLNDHTIDLPLRRNLMFDHLPSGGTTRHAAELIGSSKFSSFLAKMKQRYDVILLFSSADAATAEGHAILPIADAVIVTVQQEKKDELLVYVDWASKKGTDCATFVYVEEGG